MSFNWHPEEPPPFIDAHSKAKLDVLRSYLRAYFDTLNVYPGQDEFKLDLVDGFAGGGTFRDGDEVVSGTPLIMLEECDGATERLNKNRSKRLRIDCTCYFIEKEAAHTDHLRVVLKERGYVVNEDKIVVRNSLFEDEVDNILAEIKRRQPRAGRAIFLLDQTGFSQVQLKIVAKIMDELPAAEVILTFAADALVNFLSERSSLIKAVKPLELSERQINDMLEFKDIHRGRALIQRALRKHIRNNTGAQFDTPFFIRPGRSRRALWFLHLSKHPKARDVMIQRHWDIQNTFEHYGTGDFDMLGWDTLKTSALMPLFNFAEFDYKQMHRQLQIAMPEELFSLVSEGPVTVDAMHRRFANRTAARFSDIDSVVLKLFREHEIEILGDNHKVRASSLRNLRGVDRIVMPKQTRIFFDDSRGIWP